MSGDKMFKSLFKKDKITPEQEQALNAANMALRVRMNRIIHEVPMDTFGKAKESGKNLRRPYEGQVAA
jgi:hypothetical protein